MPMSPLTCKAEKSAKLFSYMFRLLSSHCQHERIHHFQGRLLQWVQSSIASLRSVYKGDFCRATQCNFCRAEAAA